MQRAVRILGPAALLAGGGVSIVAGLLFGRGVTSSLLLDPGAIARWGAPVSRLLVDLSVGVVIGALVLVLFALPAGAAYDRAMDVAAAGSGVWTVASAATGIFALWTIGTAPDAGPSYGTTLGQFTSLDLGQAWLVMTLAGALLTVLCFAVRSRKLLVLVLALAVAALARLANEGHAGDSSTHDVASTAIWLHILFAALWLGGLTTLALLRNVIPRDRLATILGRYSTIALISFVVVAASGYVSAAVRVGTLPNLLTPYGVLVLVKVAALLALGLFGLAYRRAIIGRIASGARDRLFWALVVAELAFMGIASGTASALAVTATPIKDVGTSELTRPTPAEILTDKPLPPELTPERWITVWQLDLLWALIVAFGTFFYLAGVWRLRQRGDRWPVHRTVLWVIGMALLLWSTNGMPVAYEEYLFSVHMTVHMTLSMAIPIFLVLGAPITLAARAIRKREDGTWGAREWILWAVHSPVAGVLTTPLVAAGLFAASLWVFYYTPIFRWATSDHLGHEWMTFHFLIVGYLFVQTLIGIDPVRRRAPYPLRLLILLATMAMHAFFGLSIIQSNGLFLADWYGAMGRTWGATPLADQQAAGGVAWSIGEIPTVTLAILVAVLWSRSDAREAKRADRRADRDGDAELEAYNAMLASRASDDAAASGSDDASAEVGARR